MSLYATVPFWPLLGAILAGVLIALRAKASAAHWPVVLGVAVSAVLAVILFFDLPGALHGERRNLEQLPSDRFRDTFFT